MVNMKDPIEQRGPGQPKKPVTEKLHPMTVRQHPKWLEMFRDWSKDQPDNQAKQVKEGIELLMRRRKNE